MKVNPGGHISPVDVIGRDDLISELWSTLASQSVVLSSERRTGKTSILKKMKAFPAPNMIPIYRDLESIYSIREFVDVTVNKDLQSYLSAAERIKIGGRWLKNTFSGWQMGPLKIPEGDITELKTVLIEAFQSIDQKEQTVILLWDELPMMLDNIRQRTNEETAMEVLNILRSIRQQFDHVRMVFTGSIGIHHVITKLKETGYSNDATNDMANHEVIPLTEAHSKELAKNLLQGEQIATEDLSQVSTEIAVACCGIPYYIHHIVKQLKFLRKKIGSGVAMQMLDECIGKAEDPWHLGHYLQRLRNYYDGDKLPLAMTILNVLAESPESIKIDQLFNLVQANMQVKNKNLFYSVLLMLELDHYIVRCSNETYKFRLDLFRKWWLMRNQ